MMRTKANTVALIHWKTARRKAPYNLDVEALAKPIDSDLWWALYRIATDCGATLAPHSRPVRNGMAVCHIFLRLSTEGDVARLLESLSRSLSGHGYDVRIEKG